MCIPFVVDTATEYSSVRVFEYDCILKRQHICRLLLRLCWSVELKYVCVCERESLLLLLLVFVSMLLTIRSSSIPFHVNFCASCCCFGFCLLLQTLLCFVYIWQPVKHVLRLFNSKPLCIHTQNSLNAIVSRFARSLSPSLFLTLLKLSVQFWNTWVGKTISYSCMFVIQLYACFIYRWAEMYFETDWKLFKTITY